MKKQLLRYLAGTMPAIALFSNLNAQIENPAPELPGNAFAYNNERIHISSTGGDKLHINAIVLKDFYKHFGNDTDPGWFDIKDGFMVKFETSGVTTKVFYDRKGRWCSTLRTYYQDKLPKDILKLVKINYFDYNIYLVNEIITGDKKAYLVSMEDEQTYKIVRIIDNEIEVYDEFNKIH